MIIRNHKKTRSSPRLEIGEIDTSPPFQSVKDAVSLFDKAAFSGDISVIKRAKACSAERLLTEETQLHWPKKQLKAQLKNAETTKAQALVELEMAKSAVAHLLDNLRTVRDSKHLAVNATKGAEDQPEGTISENKASNNCSWIRDWETAREQYKAANTKLYVVKQELRRIHQDCHAFVELDNAKESLHKVAEADNSLHIIEYSQLKVKEKEIESVARYLHVKLQEGIYELETILSEESEVRSVYEEMISIICQLSSESENAKNEGKEMKEHSEELKMEAEAARIALEEAENKLRTALEEAEAAKEAELRALALIKILSERINEPGDSTSETEAEITILREEFESLRRKVEESDRLAKMKMVEAMAQVEAMKASENETLKKLEVTQKEIVDMKRATESALKKAETAEAAKKAVEAELRRWHEREQKAAEVGFRIIAEADLSSESSPQSYHSQQQSPVCKVAQSPKSEKARNSVSKRFLLPIFRRNKSKVDNSPPLYTPSEKPS